VRCAGTWCFTMPSLLSSTIDSVTKSLHCTRLGLYRWAGMLSYIKHECAW
jgi:hypothetical protein